MNPDRRYQQVEDPFISEDLRQMELAENYNYWLFSLLKPFLGDRILEIGPGIGNLTKHFIKSAEYLEGIEPNLVCADLLMDSFQGNQKFSLQRIKVEDCEVNLLKTKKINTIVCVNVLEHINNDHETLVKLMDILTDNGKLLLLVPAISWAYGPIDASVGHFRRYSLKKLKETMEKAGFDVVFSQYSNFLGLIGWVINSKITKAVKQNDFQIRMFDNLVPILSRLEKIIIPPLGLSIIAVGRKNELK
jgi:phospholipid N-methyltransferase